MSRDALVVGINRYNGLPSLESPAKDAEAIARLLEEYGDFKVRRLPEAQKDGAIRVAHTRKVSVAELEEELLKLFLPQGNYIPDTALLYFSGHGWRKQLGILQEGFLATSDFNLDVPNYGFSLRTLRWILQQSPVRQQIVWLDCCHSGELFNFQENLKDADPGNLGEGRDRSFIAASRPDEAAYAQLGSEHSLLTEVLLKGLNPNRQPDGCVTNYTLRNFIEQALKAAPQRPIFADSAQIILTGKQVELNTLVLKGVCPYKGLEPFDFNDKDPNYFYGRQELTARLVEHVREKNVLAVVGASGSGKSSVVRAGLLYQLKLGEQIFGSDRWSIYIFRPGEHPLQSLAEVFLEPGLSAIDRAHQLRKAQELINSGSVGLGQLIAATETSRVVLVIDQFEECFTACRGSVERQQFFECLLGAVHRPDNKLCLVLTMRADFFGKCLEQDYAGLAKTIEENLVAVTPLNPEELRQAITEPAKQVGLEVEEALVTQIIPDVEGSPGCLPLLQYTLTELWEQRAVNWLTLSTYNRLGGVRGTLQKQADKVYESLLPEEKEAAKQIFLELTQLGEGTEDTRRQVFKRDLVTPQQSEELVEKVLQTLANAKLVVTNELLEKSPGAGRVAVVDVAHEALIRHWPRLRQWVDENRDALRKKRTIEEAAQEWLDKGKPEELAYLLQGSKLAEAENFFENYTNIVPLSSLAQEFIQKSIRRRRNNRLRNVSAVAGIVLVIIGYNIFAFLQSINAQLEAIHALSSSSEALFASNRELEALIEGIRAGKLLKQPFLERADTKIRIVAALQRIVYGIREQNRLEGHLDQINSVALSPDGQMLASASKDRTIKLWSRDGKEIKTLRGHRGEVLYVSFSPDGQRIASASSDNTIKLWSRDGQELKTFEGHGDWVSSISFSPDSRVLVSASLDKTLKLWSQDGRVLKTIIGHSDRVIEASFSPDGQTIVSASADGTVKLWSLEGRLLKTLSHNSAVLDVSFSPDGQMIASVDESDTVRLWSLDGKLLTSLDEEALDVSFSPNAQILASASADNTIKLWRVLDGKLLQTLRGHTDSVSAVRFSPEGSTIASVSFDKTVRLWDINGTPLTLFRKHTDSVNSISFSPDGKILASASSDKTVKLWTRDGTLLHSLEGHEDWVWGTSTYGRKFAYHYEQGTLLLSSWFCIRDSMEVNASCQL